MSLKIKKDKTWTIVFVLCIILTFALAITSVIFVCMGLHIGWTDAHPNQSIPDMEIWQVALGGSLGFIAILSITYLFIACPNNKPKKQKKAKK